MQRRVHSLHFFVCLAALALFCAATAVAQTTITVSDPLSVTSDSHGAVADLLRTGQQLEQQRRWGEALAHYEGASASIRMKARCNNTSIRRDSTMTSNAAMPTEVFARRCCGSRPNDR